jgi:hypothetical protein
MAMSQEFTKTSLTVIDKFICFVVLFIKKYNCYEEVVSVVQLAFKSRTNSNPALAHDDDFYLQNPTASPPSFSFKTVVTVVLLIFVCLLWKKL